MNTLNGYSKSTLTDNFVLTAAGGHLAVGNAKNNIPLNNGTVCTNLNADLLDDKHASSFILISKTTKSTVDGTNNSPILFNVESETLISGYGRYWYVFNMGSYSGGNFRTQIAMPYWSSLTDSELFIRSANDTVWRDWRQVLHSGNSYIKEGTITLNGNSITPLTSVSWGDILNKPTLIERTQLFSKSDYLHYVVLLCNKGVSNYTRVTGKLYTLTAGSSRYQAADIDFWYSKWDNGSDGTYYLDTYGLGTHWKLVTLTYNGATWFALLHTNIQSIVAYFEGSKLRADFTSIHYYTSNTLTVVNSEIYNSISEITYSLKTLRANITGSASKLSTVSKTAWGLTYWTSGGVPTDISGDMTGVGSINGAITISALSTDMARIWGIGHNLEFGGPGYAHRAYYFRPSYSKSGSTETNVYILNASAADSPTFTTTHSFDAKGNAGHSGTVTTRYGSNGKYLKLGPLNNSHAHYETDAGSHYFNTRVDVNGVLAPYNDNSFTNGTSGRRWSNVYSVNGDFTGAITSSLTTSTYLKGNKGTAIINSTAAAGYNMLAKMNSTNGVFTIGAYNAAFNLNYTAKTTISAETNSVTKQATLLDESGNSSFPGTVTAAKFTGTLTNTLTFSAGTFAAKTYNNSAAVTVNIPTKTSHLTNDSNFFAVTAISKNTDINTLKSTTFYYIDTDGNAGTLTNAPYTKSFAMLLLKGYESGDDLRRYRLAIDGYGAARLFNDRDTANTGGSWVDILTSKNSEISGNGGNTWGSSVTIKINGVEKTLTIPANPNVDTKVTLTNTTGSANYRVLFSANADDTTRTEGARKSGKLLFNPSSGLLTAGGFVKSGYDNTYVLLAGGGHKALSELGGASGNYVLKTGDIMTGNLLFTGGDDGRFIVIDKAGASIQHYATTTSGWSMGSFINDNAGNRLGTIAGAYGTTNTLTYFHYGGSWDNPSLVILPNKNVGIGTNSPALVLDVNGNILVRGQIINNSDPGLDGIGVPGAGVYNYSPDMVSWLPNHKSFIGSAYNTLYDSWWNLISVRHRNGYSDGNKFGMYITASLNTTDNNLYWNKLNAGTWTGERTILDSGNWGNYVSALRYEGWWTNGDYSYHADNGAGMVFAYAGIHGVPGDHWGTLVTFEYQRASPYRLLIHGDGWGNYLYFRNRSYDRGGWLGWHRIVTQSFDSYMYANAYYENSDIQLKDNIQEILNSDKMPIIKEFDWKEDSVHSYGLIAQELEEQGYSELVKVKEDGYKTVNYSAALSLIVGKLQVKIKELEKEIENLKNKN